MDQRSGGVTISDSDVSSVDAVTEILSELYSTSMSTEERSACIKDVATKYGISVVKQAMLKFLRSELDGTHGLVSFITDLRNVLAEHPTIISACQKSRCYECTFRKLCYMAYGVSNGTVLH